MLLQVLNQAADGVTKLAKLKTVSAGALRALQCGASLIERGTHVSVSWPRAGRLCGPPALSLGRGYDAFACESEPRAPAYASARAR